MSKIIEVGYELDQWEWQGTTRYIEVDPEDYRGMDPKNIGDAVYAEIRRDAEQNLYLVYQESDVVQQILDALAEDESDEEVTEEAGSHA